MKPSEIRKNLHNYVDEADSNSLKFFQDIIVAYQANHQKPKAKNTLKVASTLEPMTEKEFFAMIDEAEKNIKNGKVYSQAEVVEKMKRRHAKV